MTNLILINKNDKLAASKIILDIDNWRVIGFTKSGMLHLTTHDLKTFAVSNMTIGKFIGLIRVGIEMSREGEFIGIKLACPSCAGSGVTDWITEAMGNQKDYTHELKYNRDPDAPVYKISSSDWGGNYISYYSRAKVPDGQKHCDHCKGTGIYSMGYEDKSAIEEHTF